MVSIWLAIVTMCGIIISFSTVNWNKNTSRQYHEKAGSFQKQLTEPCYDSCHLRNLLKDFTLAFTFYEIPYTQTMGQREIQDLCELFCSATNTVVPVAAALVFIPRVTAQHSWNQVSPGISLTNAAANRVRLTRGFSRTYWINNESSARSTLENVFWFNKILLNLEIKLISKGRKNVNCSYSTE